MLVIELSNYQATLVIANAERHMYSEFNHYHPTLRQ